MMICLSLRLSAAWRLGLGLLLLGSAAPLRAQDPLISEFAAANASGLRDADGEPSDWIEIHNPADSAVALEGWFLSDDPRDLTRWRFPAISLPAHGFLVVFASTKNRTDPDGELHTNFRLERDGEYLALVHPDGVTVAAEFAPVFPRQVSDVSYGVAMRTETDVLVPANGNGRLWVPTDDRWSDRWTLPEFDDSTWAPVAMSVGYYRAEAGPDPSEPPPTPGDVSRPDDFIVATSANSPAGEEVLKAIDNNPQTKYLNFDKLNAGLTVSPAAGPTVVSGLRLTSANDAPERDPTSFVLSGSVDGRVFVEVARGAVPDFTGRFTAVQMTFANTAAYRHYRLLFPTVRNAAAAVAVQIAEVEFLGWVGGPPAEFDELIRTDIENPMYARGAAAYLRLPFTVPELPVAGQLVLRVRSEDGFVAYLNGSEAARANTPNRPAWNALASTNRLRRDAAIEQLLRLGQTASFVRLGANVLALHGLNSRADSQDFLLEARLETTRTTLGEPGYFETPTPGSENGASALGLVSDPLFDRQRGFYETPIDVSLACPTPGAAIRYTTGGGAPTATAGTLYAGPIRVARTTVLRAAAFKDGWRPSRVVTHTYLFLNDVVTQDRAATLAAGFPAQWNTQAADYGLDPRVVGANGSDSFGGKYTRTFKADLQAVPSLSLVAELDDLFGPQGIYAHPENRGEAWERPVSVELIDPDHQAGFQENAGVRIQGGAFRRFDLTLKKSFRLVFREKYGATELRYPFFGSAAADRFDSLVLRANSNDAWPYGGSRATYVRDAFAMETARALGMVAPHSTFVHLYINGFYWGLYNPVERPDAAFSATYRGGDKDTWDAINQDSVPDGTYEAWNRLHALLNQDASSPVVYQQLQGNRPDGTRHPDYEDLLDVENMIDYLILNFYVGNTDWPGRNWWVGRDRNNGDGFHFYPWDTETALGFSGLEVNVTGAGSAVARPYAAVRANAEFRRLFGDHVYRHFFNGGPLYVNPASTGWDPAQPRNNRPAARFAALADEVGRAIVGESARWGDQLKSSPSTRDEHWQAECANLLSTYFPRRSAIVIGQLRQAGLYPALDPPVMSQQGGQVPPGFALTLTAPEGTIYYTTNGADPRSPVTIRELSRQTLVARAAAKRVLVPSRLNGGDQLGTRWQGGQEPFNDALWTAGTGGVGFDQQSDYLPHLQTNLRTVMENKYGSAFVRIPFQYDGTDRDRLNFLTLYAQYDDGFVAYLNGVRLTAANVPPDPQWDSLASALNDDAAAVQFAEFKVDDGLAALKVGTNLLALLGLNVSASSSDFLINAELVAGVREVSEATNSALRYSAPLVLNDLTTVKTCAFDGQQWSALNEATFVVGAPDLVLTELHYHPANVTAAEQAAGFRDADDFEFVELFNAGVTTRDLRGVRFADGIEFDFSAAAITQLPPTHYVLVVKNRAAFEQRYGLGRPIAGEYSGRLDNAGERLQLIDARATNVFAFTYGTRAPWPETPDGFGPSLEVIDPHESLEEAANWRASSLAGGSPGESNPVPTVSLEDVRLEQDRLRFTFAGTSGAGYTLYARGALTAGDWQVLERGSVTATGQGEISVELALSPTARFFRVSMP